MPDLIGLTCCACDEQGRGIGCAAPCVRSCRCARCMREPLDGAYHTCGAHRENVECVHERVRGYSVLWGEVRTQ